MPIKKGAQKAKRQSSRRRVINVRRLRAITTSVKKVKNASPDEGKEAFQIAQKAIDKAAKNGVIKKKTAARKKSRLVVLLKKKTTQNQ